MKMLFQCPSETVFDFQARQKRMPEFIYFRLLLSEQSNQKELQQSAIQGIYDLQILAFMGSGCNNFIMSNHSRNLIKSTKNRIDVHRLEVAVGR